MAATYYVDAVNGSENNPGTSTTAAWKSIASNSKVNTVSFQPGDQVLFRRGQSWTGTISFWGKGAPGAPVVFGAYGPATDPLPHISGGGAPQVFSLWAKSYITIQDFEITNWAASDGIRDGIRLNYNGDGTFKGIQILRNKIHDIRSASADPALKANAAIYIITHENGTVRSQIDDVLIQDNEIYDTTGPGIYIKAPPYLLQSSLAWRMTNLRIEDNIFDQLGADHIVLNGASAPVVRRNAGYDAGINGAGYKYIAGMWTCDFTNETLFEFNEVARTRNEYTNGADGDGQAFDVDYGTSGSHTFQYNYTHDNYGGVLIIMPKKSGGADLQKTVIYRYNLSVNDGRNTGSGCQFAVFPVLGISSLHAYNNTFYNNRPEGFKFTGTPAAYYTNNIFHFTAAIYPPASWFSNNCYYGHEPELTDPYKLVADPKFVGPMPAGPVADGFLTVNTSPFKLQSTSPCINQGKVISNNGGVDLWGNPLYAGGHPDIGAHEVVDGGNPPPAPVTIIDNPAGSSGGYTVSYGGSGWSHATNDATFQNSTKSATDQIGHWVQVTFTGTHISLYGKKSPTQAKLDVSLNGGPTSATVDCYWPVDMPRVELYRATGLPNGTHTLRFTVAAKNPVATTNYVGIDYFQVSPVPPPALPVATVIDNTAGSYAGTWAMSAADDYSYARTKAESIVVGNYVEFTFTGTGVRLYGHKKADHGKLSISINGGTPVLVNCFSPVSGAQGLSLDYRMKLYEINGLPPGTYTLRATVATKDPAATGNRVTIDFIQALVGGATAPVITDNAPGVSVSYSGAWTHAADVGFYNSTKSVSSTVGNYVEFTFTGTGASLYAKKDAILGKLNVSVDGGTPTSVDCYATSPAYQVKVFQVSGLPYGTYTLRATVATKNPASGGNYIGIDYFEHQP
jgi:hypothetical protein